MTKRVRILIGVALLAAVGAGVWWWIAAGRESTDDAQVDAHITPIASRVGRTVLRVPVESNQEVEAGAVLVEIDKRDYEVSLERAKAELADAEAAAVAARASVPITSTTASSNEMTARGGVEQAEASYLEAQQGVEVARTRLATAQARQREAAANASKAGRDVERLKPLLAKARSRSSSSMPPWRRLLQAKPRLNPPKRRSGKPSLASASRRVVLRRQALDASRRRRN